MKGEKNVCSVRAKIDDGIDEIINPPVTATKIHCGLAQEAYEHPAILV